MAASQNPFAHWFSNENQDRISEPPPSIVGALPYSQTPFYPVSSDDLINFTFTTFNPTILNCDVLGPNNQPIFFVVTGASMPSCTFVRDVEGKNIAVVEWNGSPSVEMQGIVSKQKISDWLKLASDGRIVEILGNRYSWAPFGSYICLYATSSVTPNTLARISKSFNIVGLEMTSKAIKMGLLEICITMAMILQCGRNID